MILNNFISKQAIKYGGLKGKLSNIGSDMSFGQVLFTPINVLQEIKQR